MGVAERRRGFRGGDQGASGAGLAERRKGFRGGD